MNEAVQKKAQSKSCQNYENSNKQIEKKQHNAFKAQIHNQY